MRLPFALSALALAAIGAAQWKAVSPAGCGFTVNMPGKPVLQEQVNKEAGLPVKSKILMSGGDQAIFIASCTFLPKGMPKALRKNLLDGYCEGFMKSAGAKVVSDKATTLTGLPARRVAFTKDGDPGEMILLVHGDRFYSLTAAAADGRMPEYRKKFLASFRRTK